MGLPIPDSTLINPDSLNTDVFKDMLNDMGYRPEISTLSSMAKSKLPGYWNFFFTVLLRCLGERTTSSENANRNMLGVAYGLVHEGVDISTTLWKQFVMSLSSSSRSTEISMARFWAVIVHAIISSAKTPMLLEESSHAVFSQMAISRVNTMATSTDKHGGRLTSHMVSLLPKDNQIVVDYLKEFPEAVKQKKRKHKSQSLEIEEPVVQHGTPKKKRSKRSKDISENVVETGRVKTPSGVLKITNRLILKISRSQL